MNQRGLGFSAVLACIPMCLFAAHCDLPANQELMGIQGTEGVAGPTGKIQLLVTQEPAPFEFIQSAIITITRIEVRQDKSFDSDDDIDFCTSSTCIDGACIPMAIDCDDGDACTEDACDPSSGACSHTQMVCGTSEACVEGQCMGVCVDDVECDDGDPCTTATCTNGSCITSATCESTDPCTNVLCNPSTGACIFVASVCDAGQVCFGGGCVTPCGTDSDCDDNDMCTIGVCGPNFACEFTAMDCDDSDACTVDSCDPNSGICMNDEVVCGASEVCFDGTCYTACVESDDCNGAGNDDDNDSDSDDSHDADVDSDDDSEASDSALDAGDSDDEDDGSDDLTDDSNDDSSADADDDAGDKAGDDSDNGDDIEDDLVTQKGDDSDHDSHGSFIVIFEGEQNFDLLKLQDGSTDLLADADIPSGTYSQMRLIVTDGEVTLSDGRVFPLSVPSGEQTGIKLHFDFEISDDQDTALLLDVDLLRAFKPIPGGHINSASEITGFLFRPSLAMRLVGQHDTGSIFGIVYDAADNLLANVEVTLKRDGEEVASTFSDADGTYDFLKLAEGDYNLEFSLSDYDDAEIAGVTVSKAQETQDVDVMLSLTP